MNIEKTFTELAKDNGSWDGLLENWKAQCQEFDEDFDSYAPATLKELGELADVGHPRAGVYALKDGDNFVAVCQANCVGLPGYDGDVLRIRFMTFSPYFDFGKNDIEDYAALLVSMLIASITLSEAERRANHLKLHLKSPADRQFFAVLGTHLDKGDTFKSVKMRGAWLYITKS